jgi:hypothetical protein
METSRLGLLLVAALLATVSFAEGNRRPFRSIKAPKGEREKDIAIKLTPARAGGDLS